MTDHLPPRMSPTALSAFCFALANAIGDVERRDPEVYEQFWNDLQAHIMWASHAIPEGYAAHRPMPWEWYEYLRGMESRRGDLTPEMLEPSYLSGRVEQAIWAYLVDPTDERGR